MKKIVALGAIAALAGGMFFADEPAINTSIAEFSGNAEVKWGMDLDAGQHGFTNSTDSKLKVNLWDGGTKATEGDDVWAELKIEAKAGAIENGVFKDGAAQSWDAKYNSETDKYDVTYNETKPEIKEAKIHFGDFYVDIRSGNTQVGEFKPDAAIVADKAWLDNAGVKFENGIQAGYDAEAFKFSLDFRSYKAAKTNYTSAYGIAVNAGLKDNLVPGLTIDAGLGVNLSTDYKDCKDPAIEDTVADDVASIPNHAAAIIDWDEKNTVNTDHALPGELTNAKGETAILKEAHQIAYSLKAAYKFSLDDEMYVKPSVGFRGSYTTGTYMKETATNLENELAVGAMFGWGEVNKDANAGVPFLDGDSAKKVSEGAAVVVYIPLPSVSTWKDTKHTEHDALQAMIVPSFYLGETKVEGLKAAAYGEIGILKYIEEKDQPEPASDGKVTEHFGSIAMENETSAIALAAGLSYGITLDNDATVTPKAGFRYANSSYVNNDLYKKSDIFKNLGMQKAADPDDKKAWSADFFNLKVGVDIGGLINNTTFSVNYNSANLLNGIDTKSGYAEDTKYYNVKNGTFDVGCKIAF